MFFKLVRISKRPKLAGGCAKGFMGVGEGLGSVFFPVIFFPPVKIFGFSPVKNRNSP